MDPAASHAELMAALGAARLPEPGAFEAWQTGSAAFFLGVLLAGAAALAFRFVTRQRQSAASRALSALDAARALDPDARLLAQARILARLADGAPNEAGRPRPASAGAAIALRERLAPALYAPAGRPDLDALDAEIRALAARA